MEILELDSISYDKTFIQPYHIFNTGRFNALNSSKCEKVYYLAFKDSKVRLGIIFGVREAKLLSPFSAPFGGFSFKSEKVNLNQIDASLIALEVWVKQNQYTSIKITLPPVFYHRNFINKLYNCLYRSAYENIVYDLNYQFPISKMESNYSEDIIWNNARKNLKKSLKAGLYFEKLKTSEGVLAYDIISQNRKERGFPLRMTWEQVVAAMQVVTVDFFLIKKDTDNIAAAVVFHTAPQVVQVVYWGDLPAYSDYRTMNYLSYSVFQYYQSNEIAMVDIGPSTENSIPNFGLCEFKESIGCEITTKLTFLKNMD